MKTVGELLGEYQKRLNEATKVSHAEDYISRSISILDKDMPRLMRALTEAIEDLKVIAYAHDDDDFLASSLHDLQTILDAEKGEE